MNSNRIVVLARQATHAGRIDSLESILGFLKSLKNSGSDSIGHGENWVWLNVGAKTANSGFLVR
jgi:hypothetical protein